jgi:pyridoxal phosphate enzyme (YggS family)
MRLMDEIGHNLERVLARMAEAAKKSGRTPNEVELVAVSKTHPAEKIQAAAEAGQTLFGESRVQEARVKIPLLSSRLRWHFIGHLQKNKIRPALPFFELFHGIDSCALAQEMQRIADENGSRPRVLLQVNVAGEASKHGFSPQELRHNIENLLSLGRLTIEGLMTIPPLAPQAEMSRHHFVALRELRDAMEREFSLRMPHLSMGMSGDFEIAIEEGATLVRIGTAIFGQRSRPLRA